MLSLEKTADFAFFNFMGLTNRRSLDLTVCNDFASISSRLRQKAMPLKSWMPCGCGSWPFGLEENARPLLIRRDLEDGFVLRMGALGGGEAATSSRASSFNVFSL
jgi:hypothetical protein